jgi:hypothetical protein
LAVLGAAIVAVLSGGRWGGFTHALLRAPGYVVLAVVAQLLGAVISDHTSARWIYPTALALSAACALVFCIANLRIAGVPLVTLGLILNAIVVARNGAMPVSIAAASRAGISIVTVASDEDPRHEIAGRGSAWRPLGDVIPVPLPGVPEVISPGDLLVAAGLAEFIVVTSRRKRGDDDDQWADEWGHAAQALSMIPRRS